MGNIPYVPTTVYNAYRAKVSDGKSVQVTVPQDTTIETGKFYLLDGFLGAAMSSLTTGAGETGEVALNIEQAEYETDQINTADAFAKGDLIYWNAANNCFTTTAAGNRPAGRVTVAKDANDVIWFILGPQPVANTPAV